MKAVILAGGLGTRISEETLSRPKPMVEIGGMPILWHIMKIYSAHGINDFIVCCGYKGYFIKEYFSNYFVHMSDVTFDLSENTVVVHKKKVEPWRVTLVDTGQDTATAGRLAKISEYVKDDPAFCFTYGDGLSDLDIKRLIKFHFECGKIATVTAVRPKGRYGALEIEGTMVKSFTEKPPGDGGLVNGGFFVLSPKVFELIGAADESWESTPLHTLTQMGELAFFRHDGFWQAMDTLRDKIHLEEMWSSGSPPWRIW